MTLILGRQPADLELGYVVGDPWTDGLIYHVDGVPAPWPSAPVLEFVSAVPDIVAVLSESDSRADWSMTEAQVATLNSSSDKGVRIAVGGITWLVGLAVKYA